MIWTFPDFRGALILRTLSKAADEFPHLVMVAEEENLQGLPAGAEKQPHLQSRAAFKHILSQPPDGNSRVEMWLAETIRERAQHFLDARRVRAAETIQRGEETRTEQDGGIMAGQKSNATRVISGFSLSARRRSGGRAGRGASCFRCFGFVALLCSLPMATL